MKKILPVSVVLLLFSVLRMAAQPVSLMPVITPAGKGKVNTKIDNMGYWHRMVQKGYVLPDPVRTVPDARYTGSKMVPGAHTAFPAMPQDSPDVPVTGETEVTQSENAIFIDPSNEDVILNSNNSTDWYLGAVQNLYGADALYSVDGGEDWDGSTRATEEVDNGDPATVIGANGWWYLGRIDSDNGQAVSYSKDQGETWTKVKVGFCPGFSNTILDKNHLWIDNSPASPYNGYLYDAWTNFIPGSPDTNQIVIARSTTNGVSWSGPVKISSAANALAFNHGVNIQTGPDGEVYVAWTIYDSWPADETAIGFTRSTDGGETYTPASRIISNIKGIRTSGTGKMMRVNSFPSMTVDITNGPNRGNIYLVWSNVGVPGINTGTDIDVYMIRSTDHGSTWSAPVRVNQDPAGLGKQHYFPWITCDPVTGGLCVVYYDDRNLPSTDAAVFVSWSYDGGLTWDDMQVSDYTFTPLPIPGLAYNYFGDYIGIQSRNMKVFPVWTDNHLGGRAMTFTSPFFLGPNPNQPWVTYYSNGLIPVGGSGSTTLNNGDSLYLSLGLKNVGDQQANGVTAYISSASPYIRITDSIAAYGTMDSGQVKVVNKGYTFKVSDTIPDNVLIPFRVRATSTDSTWYSQFSLESHAPDVTVGGMIVVDTLAGNRNGRLDPGETVQFVVPNTNTGDLSCRPATARLLSDCPYLHFLSDSITFDSISPGEVKNAVFKAVVDQDAPAGSAAGLQYHLTSGAYQWPRSFRQQIGIVVEDWESQSFTKFPWQSIGTLPWTILGENPWEGNYCARSGAVPDYSSSQLFVYYTSSVFDSISFYLSTSTEEDCDFLLFYIDSVYQGKWSGVTPWTRVAFPVDAGKHMYKWSYHKDLSYSYGDDRVAVDFIVFPPPVLPQVVTGETDTICAGMTVALAAAVSNYDSLKWTTTGDGVFGNDTAAVTTYLPGPGDVATGHVTCRITGFGKYGSISRNKIITINPLPVAAISFFPNDTVCEGQSILLSADTAGISSFLWSPGNMTTSRATFDTTLLGGGGTHRVILMLRNAADCGTRDTVYLTFKNCTGIGEEDHFSVMIRPNPGNGLFLLEIAAPVPGPLNIEVHTSRGEKVYEEYIPVTGTHLDKKINLNSLPDGVYLLSLTTVHGTSMHKLIIRK